MPNLIKLISTTATQPSKPLARPSFAFELTLEAAHKNYCILRRLGSLEESARSHENTPLAYGLEFRTPTQLEPILHLHPNWPAFRRLLEEGSNWPLDDISEEERQADVAEALAFGNHKGAQTNYTLLRQLVDDDVTHGYSLPLPLAKIHLLPGVLLAPMNIVEHHTKIPANPRPKLPLCRIEHLP